MTICTLDGSDVLRESFSILRMPYILKKILKLFYNLSENIYNSKF